MSKPFLSSALRFVVAGGISTAINYSAFFVMLRYLEIDYLISSICGYIAGLLIGFLINHYWTFNAGAISAGRAAGYISVYLFSLALSTLFMWISVTKFGGNAFLMNLLSIVLSTVCNFIGLKYIIYQKDVPK